MGLLDRIFRSHAPYGLLKSTRITFSHRRPRPLLQAREQDERKNGQSEKVLYCVSEISEVRFRNKANS